MSERWYLVLVLPHLKIGFLGAGRMSQALARSLIEQKVVSSENQIIASDIDDNQRKLVTVSYLVSC
jgi:pyrroline-5-carboxylate reductase